MRRPNLLRLAALGGPLSLAAAAWPLASLARGAPAADRWPEVAPAHGYFVAADEARARGGVGNYVPRPSGRARAQRDRLARIARFASLERDGEGVLVIRLKRDLLFDVNSSDVRPGAADELAALAAYLRSERYAYADLEGFADATGPEAGNKDLSRRRAETIRAALRERGVDTSAMDVAGFGSAFPAATNATPAGRAENRRVEVVVIR